jgi:choline dehydrogenase-like flavoprotein
VRRALLALPILAFFSSLTFSTQPSSFSSKQINLAGYPNRLYDLYPVIQAVETNFRVIDNTRVEKVLFEGDKAVGIAYSNKVACECGSSPVHYLRASKGVVLATEKGSDTLLEQSGVRKVEETKELEVSGGGAQSSGVRSFLSSSSGSR